jgi:hypothetical protein
MDGVVGRAGVLGVIRGCLVPGLPLARGGSIGGRLGGFWGG